jgi:hypothetical protein
MFSGMADSSGTVTFDGRSPSSAVDTLAEMAMSPADSTELIAAAIDAKETS